MKKKINISDKALKFIEQQQIRPIPRWEFVVKNLSVWIGVILSLIIIIFGFGISFFGFSTQIITPNFWIITGTMSLFLSYFLFIKTKKSYRFQKLHVFMFMFMVGSLFGFIFFKSGYAGLADRRLGTSLASYRQIVPLKLEVWNNPSMGYLSGTITESITPNSFRLKDFSGNYWEVSFISPVIRGRVQLDPGQEIKLIGQQTDTSFFFADEIRPWVGGKTK